MIHEVKESKSELSNILNKIKIGEGVKFIDMISKNISKNCYNPIKDAENKTGVYFIYNTKNKEVVYVGESSNWCLKKRMSQHCIYHYKNGNIIKNMIDLEHFDDANSAILLHLRE
ncbi:GIY-YIG nuclease family protein [Priestia flexa]|uniref:GIY-YIG nuclease family protein n=1 Tax=Priestia flexa TaxID=86664 RepID=UPI00209DEFE7|nr:GIY-YIG nuclease family protein [Priestia flexa]MCP1188036.1 GIY-YIG nuclease family protein [Priestia flexa]